MVNQMIHSSLIDLSSNWMQLSNSHLGREKCVLSLHLSYYRVLGLHEYMFPNLDFRRS